MKKLTIVLAFLLASYYSFSQDYEMTHYTVKDGLMSNLTSGFFQDSLGRMWVSNARGFTIFYGDHYKNLKSNSNISVEGDISKVGDKYFWENTVFNDDTIYSINHILQDVCHQNVGGGLTMIIRSDPFLDSKGFYWAFNNNKDSPYFVRYNLKDTINLLPFFESNNLSFNDSSLYSNNFIIDNQKNIWIKTKDNGIYKYSYEDDIFISFKGKVPFLSSLITINDSITYATGKNIEAKMQGIYIFSKSKNKFHECVGNALLKATFNEKVFYIDGKGLNVITGDSSSLIMDGVFFSEWNNETSEFYFLRDNFYFTLKKESTTELYICNYLTLKPIMIHVDKEIRNLFISNASEIWYSTNQGIKKLQKTKLKEIKYRKSLNLEFLFENKNKEDYFIDKQKIGFQNWINSIYMIDNDDSIINIYEEKNETSTPIDSYINWTQNQSQEDIFYFMNVFSSINRVYRVSQSNVESIISDKALMYLLSEKLTFRSLESWNNNVFILCREGIVRVSELNNYQWFPFPDSVKSKQYISFNKTIKSDFTVITFANQKLEESIILGFDYYSLRYFNFFEGYSQKDQFQFMDYNNYRRIKGNKILTIRESSILIKNKDSVLVLNAGFFKKNQIVFKLQTQTIKDSLLFVICSNNGLLVLNLENLKYNFYSEFLPYNNLSINDNQDELWFYNLEDALILDLNSFINKKQINYTIWNQKGGYNFGRLVFKGNKASRFYNKFGYVELNRSIKISTATPKIYFSTLLLNYENFDWSSSTTKIDSSSGNIMPYNMKLTYDENHLTFNFQGVSHSNKVPLTYFYKLVGLDNKLIATTNKSATYSNLESGDYTFQVYVQDENESKSEIITCSFTISPPFWETWWFISLCLIAIGGVLYSGYNYNVKRLKARQEELEHEVEIATIEIREQKDEIEKQKDEVEEKHREITDSINYAERIQRSFLATTEMLDKNLKDYFVFFRPKEAVSGDFYWAGELNNGNFAFSCADSTGHGVPGAIMSILNISSLEKSIEEETEPNKILDKTRKIIIERLKKDGSSEGGKDGMDCSLMVINKDRTQLSFAAANNPVFIVRNYELIEFKPDKMPVGKHDKDAELFSLFTSPLEKGDIIYTLTDGFPDQFGGMKGKKYMIKNLKELLLQIAPLSMEEQEQKLAEEFATWKGENEQVDDVCIIGVRI